jgi:hypothetical protein
MRAFLFMFATLMSFAARADNCSTLRLDEGQGPFTQIPVYDQTDMQTGDDTNMCYAIVAAEMVDAYRHSIDPKSLQQLTAPFSFAMGFKSSKDPFELNRITDEKVFLGAGRMKRAIVETKYACDQNWLNQFDHSMGIDKNMARQITDKIKIGSGTFEFLKSIVDQMEKYRAVLDNRSFANRLFGSDPEPEMNEYFHCLHSGGAVQIVKIASATKAAWEIDVRGRIQRMQQFVFNLCKDHRIEVKVPEPHEYERDQIMRKTEEGKNQVIQDQILNNLNAKKPTAVTFCSTLLNKPDSANTSRCGLQHVAVAIGRRANPDTKKCEILIRNSYGPNCFKTDGTPKYAWPCENGSVWVPAERLTRDIQKLGWI